MSLTVGAGSGRVSRLIFNKWHGCDFRDLKPGCGMCVPLPHRLPIPPYRIHCPTKTKVRLDQLKSKTEWRLPFKPQPPHLWICLIKAQTNQENCIGLTQEKFLHRLFLYNNTTNEFINYAWLNRFAVLFESTCCVNTLYRFWVSQRFEVHGGRRG